MLNLREAAEMAGTSKSSVFRAIKSGRLSATRTDAGEFRVDPAEVARVYTKDNVPLRGRRAPVEQPEADDPANRSDVANRNATLEGEVKALSAEVRLLRELADNFKAERDKWQQQAERLALAPPKPEPKIEPARRGWWLFRRSA
jgi:hypothetical protein